MDDHRCNSSVCRQVDKPRDEHEPIGGSVQNQAELVGLWIAARGPVRSELRLVPLDKVLRLAAGAANGLVEMLCRTLERGDDVTDVETFGCRLDAGDNAALSAPTSGGVAQGGEGAQLRCRAGRPSGPQRIGSELRHGLEDRVAAKAKNVVNTLL